MFVGVCIDMVCVCCVALFLFFVVVRLRCLLYCCLFVVVSLLCFCFCVRVLWLCRLVVCLVPFALWLLFVRSVAVCVCCWLPYLRDACLYLFLLEESLFFSALGLGCGGVDSAEGGTPAQPCLGFPAGTGGSVPFD